MSNNTDCTVWCREADVYNFNPEVESITTVPGIWEVDFEGHPSELHESKDIPFVGYHCGHQGDYEGQIFYCRGDGDLHAHACDVGGRPILPRISPQEWFVKTDRLKMEELARRDTEIAIDFMHEVYQTLEILKGA